MSKIKVLIAEDDELSQKNLNLGLSDKIFEKQIASNGKDALKIYHASRPDILFLDIMMPINNGYMILKKIRTEYNDNDTTIIMASALNKSDEIMRCVQYNIQGYLIKPVKIGEVGQKAIEYYSKLNPEKGKKAMEMLVREKDRKKESGDSTPAQVDDLFPLLSMKDALEIVDDDKDLLVDTFNFFIKDSPTMISEIEKTVESGDDEEFDRKCHILKGLLKNVAAHEILVTMGELEDKWSDKDLDSVKNKLTELSGKCNSLKEFFEGYIDK